MGNCRSDSAIVISEEKRNIKFAVPDTNESPSISGTSQQTDKTYLKVSNPDQEETTTRRKKIPLNESIPNKDGSTTSHTTQNSTTVPIEGTPVLSTEDMNDIKETIKTCWKEVDRQCQGYKGSTKHISHSSGWRIARVFVSSTFTDFHDEREILVKKVFPEIREWCEERHINLIDCDLRWGIPKEATTEETINTCLEELDRCHEETDGKPFFLGMVGKRYGWIPGDNEVSDEMRKRFQWVNKTSITFMEFLHGSLRCKSPNAAFFIRGNDIGYESLPEDYIKRFVDADYLNQEHLNELKKRLKKDFPNQVFNYSCKIDGITVAEDTGRENVKLTGMDDFTNQAVQFLKKAITKTYGDKGLKKIMEYDIENDWTIKNRRSRETDIIGH